MTTPSKTRTVSSKKPSNRQQKSSETGRNGRPVLSHSGKKLVKRVLNESSRTKTLHTGSKILVAVSGGPDSTALLHILMALKEKLSLGLAVAHVNYGLRGIDSEKDEAAVVWLCKKQGIPLSVLRPKGMIGKNEEVLRDVRYLFFEKIRDTIGFDLIATAHTEDDQAETILLRLLRGAGPEGLSGMRPKSGRLIRPLLQIPKHDLIAFLKEERIPFRIDKTNRDTGIFRNRIRNKLLPLLEREYQPNIRQILARTSENILPPRTRGSYSYLPVSINGNISFSRSAFLTLQDDGRSETIRGLFRLISGTVKNPSSAFVREARKLIESRKNKVQRFESGQLKIEARGDTVVMIRIS